MSFLAPGLSLFFQILKFRRTQKKIAEHVWSLVCPVVLKYIESICWILGKLFWFTVIWLLECKSKLLYITVHHPTKFQADIWNPYRVTAVTSSFRPGQKNFHGKFKSSVEHAENSRAYPFLWAICSMVLCIILPNFRVIPEILKELEWQRCPSDLVKKPIMENFKVPWNTQELAEHSHF